MSELHPVVGAVLCCLLKQRNLLPRAASLNAGRSVTARLPRSLAAACRATFVAVLPYLKKQKDRKMKEVNGELCSYGLRSSGLQHVVVPYRSTASGSKA